MDIEKFTLSELEEEEAKSTSLKKSPNSNHFSLHPGMILPLTYLENLDFSSIINPDQIYNKNLPHENQLFLRDIRDSLINFLEITLNKNIFPSKYLDMGHSGASFIKNKSYTAWACIYSYPSSSDLSNRKNAKTISLRYTLNKDGAIKLILSNSSHPQKILRKNFDKISPNLIDFINSS